MIPSVVVYIHGKDGSATESEHYKPLFPDYEVIGLDYQTFTPWETVMESGEHWSHTEEQMLFLDKWIKESIE